MAVDLAVPLVRSDSEDLEEMAMAMGSRRALALTVTLPETVTLPVSRYRKTGNSGC